MTYSYNFNDPLYEDCAAILSVLAQAAIDGCKRSFAANVNDEIKYFKKKLNVAENGKPYFWFQIKRKGKFAASESQKRMKEEMKGYNPSLVCPMDYLCRYRFSGRRKQTKTISLEDLYVFVPMDGSVNRGKKIEKIISKYSGENWKKLAINDDPIALELEYMQMIEEIRTVRISKDDLPLMSWLIGRAFLFHEGTKERRKRKTGRTYKNRPLLTKVLYTCNPELFLDCFKSLEDDNAKNNTI